MPAYTQHIHIQYDQRLTEDRMEMRLFGIAAAGLGFRARVKTFMHKVPDMEPRHICLCLLHKRSGESLWGYLLCVSQQSFREIVQFMSRNFQWRWFLRLTDPEVYKETFEWTAQVFISELLIQGFQFRVGLKHAEQGFRDCCQSFNRKLWSCSKHLKTIHEVLNLWHMQWYMKEAITGWGSMWRFHLGKTNEIMACSINGTWQ